MILQKFKSYLLLKKDPQTTEGKPNFNLKMMHGINKISILLFLFSMIFLVIKLLTK
jgi:hypothetical protein